MNTNCYIFARGGSKGIIKKNIRNLIDKPLIAYSILLAKEISQINKIFVSTDSDEISQVAKEYGAIVIKRPDYISKDESPEWLAWQHAIKWTYNNYGKFYKFVSLPCTAPLRKKEDVEKCIDAFNSIHDVILTMTESSRNPWFNMVKKNEKGLIDLVINEQGNFTRRQDAPTTYDLTTVAYVLSPDFIMENESLWQGNVRGVFIPKERAIDIDTELDLKIAEFLIQEK